ncbi:MAG: DUF3316 domain-containing protein [Bacteroidaceae bacterium]|nr:DUF3316 domain-containing protein [Bacteroidaceae bacterium]
MKHLSIIVSVFHRGWAIAILLLLSLHAYAQEDVNCQLSTVNCQPNKEVLHSTLFGVGWSNVLDTYLSPYNYKGTDFRIQRETMRMTTLWNGNVSNQSLIDFNVGFNKSHAGHIDEYAGGFRYSQGWFYNFMGGNIVNPVERSSSRWNFAAGLVLSGYLGGIYIDRSGNNPGQVKADLMMDASGMVTYDMLIARHHYLWRYQVSLPFIGIAFSPHYGESYYEIYTMGNNGHNVVFAYPGNMPSMRHKLTIDIPIRRYTLRVGYVAQIQQSTFHHLKYHSYTHDFVIGFNKYLYRR